MDCDGLFWIIIDSFGLLLIMLDHCGLLWILIDSFGMLWIVMDYYRLLILWIVTDYYGFYCGILGGKVVSSNWVPIIPGVILKTDRGARPEMDRMGR